MAKNEVVRTFVSNTFDTLNPNSILVSEDSKGKLKLEVKCYGSKLTEIYDQIMPVVKKLKKELTRLENGDIETEKPPEVKETKEKPKVKEVEEKPMVEIEPEQNTLA